MGSWSVYCGISHIAITSGKPCVMIPLRKALHNRHYLPYEPATLPIFGVYDDYGGIEGIEIDDNTKLIEEHFGCTIDEFCYFFTRGSITKNDSDISAKLKKNKEIKNWTFMFISREVYDFMSTYTPKSFGWAGDFPMGDKEVLKVIGFTQISKNKWGFQGKEFNTDGYSLKCDGKDIYRFSGDWCALTDHVEIPDDKKWLADKAMWQLWDQFETNKKLRALFMPIMGGYYDDERCDSLAELILEDTNEARIAKGEAPLAIEDTMPRKTILDKYAIYVRKFGKLFCDLTTIRHNLYPMSGWFEPHQIYVTPQCGEHSHHQVLLDKFAEINQKILKSYEED